jgi:hypothetical protein
MKKFRGLGPFVYLLINNGSMICNGVRGTANKPSFSFGTPASINLRNDMESVANAIYNNAIKNEDELLKVNRLLLYVFYLLTFTVIKMIMSFLMGANHNIRHMSMYVCLTFKCSSMLDE